MTTEEAYKKGYSDALAYALRALTGEEVLADVIAEIEDTLAKAEAEAHANEASDGADEYQEWGDNPEDR